MTVKAALNAGEYFHGIKLKFASAIYFQKKCIYSFLVHRYRVGGVYKGCSGRRVSRVEIVTSQNAPLHRDCIRRSHLPEDRRVVRRKRSDGRVGATVSGRLVLAAFVSHSNDNNEYIVFVVDVFIVAGSRGRPWRECDARTLLFQQNSSRAVADHLPCSHVRTRKK